MALRAEVQESFRARERGEEYAMVLLTSKGVSVPLEEAIMTAMQLIADVASNEGLEITLDCGRVDPEVSYTPRQSMTSHIIIASHDTYVRVV